MPRRLFGVGLLLIGCFAGVEGLHGQDLADVIVELIDQNFELGTNQIAGSPMEG